MWLQKGFLFYLQIQAAKPGWFLQFIGQAAVKAYIISSFGRLDSYKKYTISQQAIFNKNYQPEFCWVCGIVDGSFLKCFTGHLQNMHICR